MQGAHDFEVTEYRLLKSRVTVQMRGDKWAVCLDNLCLDKDDLWSHEPLPSARDEWFLSRHRFDKLEDAFAAARRAHRLDMEEMRKLNERASANSR